MRNQKMPQEQKERPVLSPKEAISQIESSLNHTLKEKQFIIDRFAQIKELLITINFDTTENAKILNEQNKLKKRLENLDKIITERNEWLAKLSQ